MKFRKWLTLIVVGILLTSCRPGNASTPLPTVVLEDNTSALNQSTPGVNSGNSSVIASGILVSDHQANLAFISSGNVKSVNAVVGQKVKAGDLLAALDDTLLQARLDEANRALAELTSPLAISNAQKAVADDLVALEAAEGTYYWWFNLQENSQDLLKKAQADLAIAQDELKKAQEDYNKITGEVASDKDKAQAYEKIFTAQQKVNEAQTRINLYTNIDPLILAQHKAAVDVAKAKLAEDQAYLAALTGGDVTEEPTGANYYALVQAQNNVAIATAALKDSQLIAPFDGTVSVIKLSVGDFALAGVIQIVVTDTLHLHVETTDLSERDVSGIKVGQKVTVTIKPLNQQITGVVSAISPLAETLGGDVVYRAYIRLDSLPDGALPGMTSTVVFINE